jgi:hypothetical protein
MKKLRGYIIGLFAVILVAGHACQDQSVNSVNSGQDQAFQSQQMDNDRNLQAVHRQRNFRTHLNGENEVPAAETNARGQAVFKVSKDGSSIDYKLIVANIENVTMAHIHLAPAGVNGPVVVWLYPDAPPPQLIEGRFQGVLAEGTFTAENLVGPMAGATLDDLVEAIEAGNTYVNVHTGQFPAGEVRGQIH